MQFDTHISVGTVLQLFVMLAAIVKFNNELVAIREQHRMMWKAFTKRLVVVEDRQLTRIQAEQSEEE